MISSRPAKTNWKTSPAQNTGMPTPISEPVIIDDFNQRELVEPATMPKGTPTVSVKQKAAKRQFERGRQKVAQLLQDRLARGDRQAQVARQQPLHVFEILNMQGLVKAEQRARLRDLFLGGELPGPRKRRIAGQHIRYEEGNKGYRDQDPQGLIQPAQNIVTQGWSPQRSSLPHPPAPLAISMASIPYPRGRGTLHEAKRSAHCKRDV